MHTYNSIAFTSHEHQLTVSLTWEGNPPVFNITKLSSLKSKTICNIYKYTNTKEFAGM